MLNDPLFKWFLCFFFLDIFETVLRGLLNPYAHVKLSYKVWNALWLGVLKSSETENYVFHELYVPCTGMNNRSGFQMHPRALLITVHAQCTVRVERGMNVSSGVAFPCSVR
jgi:hypothetical protein